jgi:hypothetical protein
MSRTDPPPAKKNAPPSQSGEAEVTVGEISLDDLDLEETPNPRSTPSERITVTPGTSEREYVARMMRQIPSPLPPDDPLEMLTLDLPEMAFAPPGNARTPTPSPLPPVESIEGTRRSSGAPRSFRPAAGDALELVEVRSKSVRPALAPNITMRAVRDRFDVGDFSGALILAEGILESEPESVDALLYAEHCRDVLTQMYISRLGGMKRIPHIAVTNEQLRWLALDHRAGFLLSLVDGRSSFEEVLDVSGMSTVDALRLLMDLLQQNVIRLG